MEWYEILKIVGIALTFVAGTLIPCVIKLVKNGKALHEAKTEAEREAAKNDMLSTVNTLVANAEQSYKEVDAVLKQRGASAGSVKKDSVMTKLQAYALDKGYEFDAEFWSAQIDEIVSLTKTVNAK